MSIMSTRATLGYEAYLLIPGAQLATADTDPNNGDVVTFVKAHGKSRYTVEYADGVLTDVLLTRRNLKSYVRGYEIPIVMHLS